MCCIMKLSREIIFLPGKLMFSHKNIKLFEHLALLIIVDVLVKEMVQWFVYQIECYLGSATFNYCCYIHTLYKVGLSLCGFLWL